ncbi:hypothetical protein G9A89_007064 [Geosiphon pyriformis]|nr:hypothetical protein G9A89_007064 [Geosiphon pyriformis]
MEFDTVKTLGPQVQVRFFTQQSKYAVTDSAILVPAELRRYGLSEIINHLLAYEKPVPFDFLIEGQFLRTSLSEYLQNAGLSTENVISLEYVESMLPPAPLSAYQHDDWISSVKSHNKGFFLTGSYDNKVRIWNKSGKCIHTLVGHQGPVKSVAWGSSQDNEEIICLSASQDRTIRAWHTSLSNDSSGVLYECHGHKGGVESITINATGTEFASASCDSLILLWTTAPLDESESDHEVIKSMKKRRKVQKYPKETVTKKPIGSFNGHIGPVSSVIFDNTDSSKLYSGGWDHSIRIWDVESRVNIDTKNCGKVVNNVAHSSKSGLIASGHPDRVVRLWDPRAEDIAVVKLSLASHQNWVSAVSWSHDSPFLLASASYDSTIRIWDIRSKTPLYILQTGKGKTDKKLLCIDWSYELLLAGGEDSQMHIFSAKKISGSTGD